MSSGIESVCNFGCHPDLWPHLGEDIFLAIKNCGKNIALSAWPGEQAEIDRWLYNGLIDIALCYGTTLREKGSTYSLPAEKLLLVSTTPRELMRWDPNYVYVDSGE